MGGTTATGTPGTALDPIAYPSPPRAEKFDLPGILCGERKD